MPAPAEKGIHTPEQLRQDIEDWPAAYKIVVDKDVVVRFAYPHPMADWVGSAFVHHIPSMSHIIFDLDGQVHATRYESQEGRARLEAVLQDRALVDRIRQRIQEVHEAADVLYGLPITELPPDVSDLPRQALDTTIWPRDLYDQHYVGIGQADREVYLVDLRNGHAARVTDDGGVKLETAITERYIAWTVEAGQITVRDGDHDEKVVLQHIYVLDRATGEQRRITQDPAPRKLLVADGYRLVWMDKRNELQEHYTHYDLYAYDLAADIEIPVAVAPGAQQSPSIHGDLIVWADNHNSPHLGTPLSGCGNCPENRFDIYLYDFGTQTARAIAEDEWQKSAPSVYGRRVAWMTWRDERQTPVPYQLADIHLLDLDTGVRYQVTATPDATIGPVLSGDRLLWRVVSACDVISKGPDGKEILPQVGVYALDLRTGEVLRG
jgi:hypothetical protein